MEPIKAELRFQGMLAVSSEGQPWRLTGIYGYPDEQEKPETWRFTWRNGRAEEAFMEERLDRACASAEWSELHPRAKVTYLMASYSDHDPILLDTTPAADPTPRRWHKLHRFKEKWVSHPECEQIIYDSWTHSQALGSPMNWLFEKIKKCQSDLVARSQHTFGNTWTVSMQNNRNLGS
nr:hypothetical protein CFP56_51330 [Quercus suber]